MKVFYKQPDARVIVLQTINVMCSSINGVGIANVNEQNLSELDWDIE